MGQMAFPSLVTHVLQNYGVRSGTLIMSAFSLHLCITAALMPRHFVEVQTTEPDIAISSTSISRRTGEPSSNALPSPPGGSTMDIEAREIDAMLQQKRLAILQIINAFVVRSSVIVRNPSILVYGSHSTQAVSTAHTPLCFILGLADAGHCSEVK